MSQPSRREWLIGAATGVGAVLMGGVHAAPPSEREARRLANRLQHWETFARKTQNLLVRYASVRKSPLLLEDLVGSGTLAFVAPKTLVMRDDSATGSTTRITEGSVEIIPNDPSIPRRALPPRAESPALAWLADHLVACFAPGDGSALVADARTEVPRGRTPRLSLLPPRDSAARALIRSLTLTLEQAGGAVVQIEIAESDGSSFVAKLSDHRQNVEPEMLERVLERPR